MSKSRCLVGANSAALIVSGMLLSVPLAGWAQIEEIVVSTRRTDENVQDVPIAVDAISAEQIARMGIGSVEDVTKLSTSVQFDQSYGPADTRIAIRGLSNTRGRSNVAFLVDNVDTTTENFISAGSGLLTNQRLLVDVEQIEIVKGPQSALFGRAAFAGAISYTTADPGDEFEGDLRLTAGDAGLFELSGVLGGPVIGMEDKLGVRVSGTYWTEDGFYTNSVSGNQVGGQEGWGTAVTALFTPVDEVRVKWRTEYSDSKYGQTPSVRIGGGSSGPGNIFYRYPADGDNDNIAVHLQGPHNTQTRLIDFGQYCPESAPDFPDPNDPNAPPPPGLCAPAGMGGASGLQPALSEDAVTGEDYRGTDTQLLRTTLNMSMDYEFGSFSSITGFTDYDAFNEGDQDYQAVGRPDTLKAHQQARSDLDTKQFSQELRFASNFEGPMQVTLGALYWKEDRRQEDLNYIISCIEYGKHPPTQAVWPDPNAFNANVCDGNDGSTALPGDPGITVTGPTMTSWQEQALQHFPCVYQRDANGDLVRDANGNALAVQDPDTGTCVQGPRTGSPWRADTEHKSLYFKLAWDLSDTWTLDFEDRFVWEDFDLIRQSMSGCSALFFIWGPIVTGGVKEGPVTNQSQDHTCRNERVLNPALTSGVDVAGGQNWFLLQGSESSSYSTPKLTARWQATDDLQTYFSWGIGQKPGGINTLSAGGSPTTIDDERFDSEKVTAWELGIKSDWELAGFLRLNAALFFNDYTDKQVGTQVVKSAPDGSVVLQPRIINAGRAEVWGLELNSEWQPSFVDGLVVSAAYTYLHAEFTDFLDDTRSLQRSALNGQCQLIYKLADDPEQTVVEPPPGFDPDTTDPNDIGLESFCRLDMNGFRLERTPEHAFTGNLQYTRGLMNTGIDYFVELTGTYEGDRYIDFDNAVKFDAYWLFDTRFGLMQDNWEFLFYIDNLFDDDTIQTGGSGPDFSTQVTQLGFPTGFGLSHYFALLPDPRTFGAKLTIRF